MFGFKIPNAISINSFNTNFDEREGGREIHLEYNCKFICEPKVDSHNRTMREVLLSPIGGGSLSKYLLDTLHIYHYKIEWYHLERQQCIGAIRGVDGKLSFFCPPSICFLASHAHASFVVIVVCPMRRVPTCC